MHRLLIAALFSFFLAGSLVRAAALPDAALFEKLKGAVSPEEADQVALDIYAGWLESGSATVDLLMQRAMQAQAYGDVVSARQLYDRIILIAPDYAEAFNRRAGLFLTAENTPEALRDLNEVLRLEPRHFGAWTGLGLLFESVEADKQALTAYREALKIYPTLPPALQAEAALTKKVEGLEL
jgi:tetratricopeptide (TPR) repeat protein